MSIKWGPIGLGLAIGSAILIAFSRSAKASPFEVNVALPEAAILTPWWNDEDFVELARICDGLKMNPADLLLVMTAESGLNPGVCNPPNEKCQVIGGHPVAVGLIQFTKVANGGVGISEYERQNVLPTMSVAQQLPLVEKYFQAQPWTRAGNEYANAGNVYQAVFAGGTMINRGTSLDTILYDSVKNKKAYDSNHLDLTGKGYINVQDLVDYMRRVSTNKGTREIYQAGLARLREATGDENLSPNLP